MTEGINVPKFDSQGRIQKFEFDEFEVYNVYFPSEGTDSCNFEFKCEFYDVFTDYVQKSKKPQVICGDFNRISTMDDTYYTYYYGRGFRKRNNEREWFQNFLKCGFVDTFRLFNNKSGNYTWWSRRGTCKEDNKGFRFDYFLVNEELKDNVVDASILHQIPTDDHAPITLELEF